MERPGESDSHELSESDAARILQTLKTRFEDKKTAHYAPD